MIRKLFKQMVASQIISAMAATLCLTVDSIMIGRFLGVDAMAAYGFVNPVIMTFTAFGSLLSVGIQFVCSRAMGMGDEEKINKCFSSSVMAAVSISLISVAVVILFADPLSVILGARKGTEVFRLTRRYLIGFVIGEPAFICMQLLVPFLQMAGQRARIVASVLTMTLSNLLFDLLNALVFKCDNLGMGLASSFSYYIAIMIGAIYFFRKKCIYQFSFHNASKAVLLEIIKGGIPTVINSLSLVFLVYIINHTMMKIGSAAAVAAFSVVSTIANISYCFGGGISEVSLMLTGIAYGEEDKGSLREIVKQLMWFVCVIDGIAMVIYCVSAGFLARLFIESGTDAEITLSYTTSGIRFFAICLIPSAINMSLKKYYQAIGRVLFSEVVAVMQNLVFPGIAAVTLGNILGTAYGVKAGITGVWLNYVLGETIALLLITIMVKRISGKKFASLDSYACVPKEFGVSEENVCELEIRSMQDVHTAIDTVYGFCKSVDESPRRTFYTAVCVEEMVVNILQHGFKNRKGIALISDWFTNKMTHSYCVYGTIVKSLIRSIIIRWCVRMKKIQRVTSVSGWSTGWQKI